MMCRRTLSQIWKSRLASLSPLPHPLPGRVNPAWDRGSEKDKALFHSHEDKATWTSSQRHWSTGTRNSLGSHPWQYFFSPLTISFFLFNWILSWESNNFFSDFWSIFCPTKTWSWRVQQPAASWILSQPRHSPPPLTKYLFLFEKISV